MLKFIWFGVAFCGIANGLLYSYVASPDKYIYMSVVALLCIGLILLYYHCTKNWLNNKDYDEDHSMVFIPSAVVSLIAIFIGFVTCASLDFFVGVFTFGIPCGIMGKREHEYML